MNRLPTALWLSAALALAGCSILQPQPDPSRFYVLTASVEEAAVPAGGADELMLGLGPIKLPDYLDRAQMVTRVGPNQVVFSEFERWAERLERNFSRVLGENLSRLLGTEKIISLPAFIPAPLRFEVPIEVLRFESDDRGVVELWARWAIRNASDRKLLHAHESRVTETANGTETQAVVAALGRAVGKLGEEIAAEVRRLSAAS
jgi:hypothetical protein